jgi:hypothetical protein
MQVTFDCGLLGDIFPGHFLLILCKTYPQDFYIYVVIFSCFVEVWLFCLLIFKYVSLLDLSIANFWYNGLWRPVGAKFGGRIPS